MERDEEGRIRSLLRYLDDNAPPVSKEQLIELRKHIDATIEKHYNALFSSGWCKDDFYEKVLENGNENEASK